MRCYARSRLHGTTAHVNLGLRWWHPTKPMLDSRHSQRRWTDALQSSLLSASALEETARLCLEQAAGSHFSFFRPHERSSAGTPKAFQQLLSAFSTHGNAELMSGVGVSVAGLYLELLEKPVHPQHSGGEWDVSDEELLSAKQRLLASVTACLRGNDGLEWLRETLVSPAAACSSSPPVEPHEAILSALKESLFASSSTKRATKSNVREELLKTSAVVSLALSAMLQTGSSHIKHAALDFLESTVAQMSHSSARANVVFRMIVTQCAEAAAQCGEVEVVVRLIFLLYRADGATFGPPPQHEGRAAVGWQLLLRRVAQFFKRESTLPLTLSATLSPSVTAEVDHHVSTRLLKSVIHASLVPVRKLWRETAAPHCEEAVAAAEAAYELLHALAPGSVYPGTAAMVVELLTFTADAQQRWFNATRQTPEWKKSVTVHHASQRLVSIANKTFEMLSERIPADSRRYSFDSLCTCAELALRSFTGIVTLHHWRGAAIEMPVMTLPLPTGSDKSRPTVGNACSQAVFRVLMKHLPRDNADIWGPLLPFMALSWCEDQAADSASVEERISRALPRCDLGLLLDRAHSAASPVGGCESTLGGLLLFGHLCRASKIVSPAFGDPAKAAQEDFQERLHRASSRHRRQLWFLISARYPLDHVSLALYTALQAEVANRSTIAVTPEERKEFKLVVDTLYSLGEAPLNHFAGVIQQLLSSSFAVPLTVTDIRPVVYSMSVQETRGAVVIASSSTMRVLLRQPTSDVLKTIASYLSVECTCNGKWVIAFTKAALTFLFLQCKPSAAVERLKAAVRAGVLHGEDGQEVKVVVFPPTNRYGPQDGLSEAVSVSATVKDTCPLEKSPAVVWWCEKYCGVGSTVEPPAIAQQHRVHLLSMRRAHMCKAHSELRDVLRPSYRSPSVSTSLPTQRAAVPNRRRMSQSLLQHLATQRRK